MVDVPVDRPSRWRTGWRLRDIVVTRARVLLLASMLCILGWSAAWAMTKVANDFENCDTAIGKLHDQVRNRLFRTALRCGCDGRLDLSTGCLIPGVF